MNYSLTTSGIALAAVGWLLTHLGITAIDANGVLQAVSVLATVIGGVVAYLGRYRQGDITWYGKKLN